MSMVAKTSFKLCLLLILFLICSCKYLDGDMTFLSSTDCMDSIKANKQTCTLVYAETKIPLRFEPTPYLKGAPYKLTILSEDIVSAKAELIGLSMNMPPSQYDFSKALEAIISPGICTETKMMWRLKITMVSKNNESYYTFIDYQIGR